MVMPTYEFICKNCGPFETWREMGDAGKPMACSTCKAAAERIFSAPALIMTSSALRQRVERSAEPRVIKQSQNKETVAKKKHLQKSSGRPWMIAH
jgi:putative FmdB family regulatory protein